MVADRDRAADTNDQRAVGVHVPDGVVLDPTGVWARSMNIWAMGRRRARHRIGPGKPQQGHFLRCH